MADIGEVRLGMAVYGSCGHRVGTVGGAGGGWLRLSRDPGAGDEAHQLPMGWVDSVAGHVRLNRPCEEVLKGWQPLAAAGW
jgi:hypothetical protein